jgi:hypothetical protein
MFDDFDLSDAAKAAGLAALIGGGYAAARKVPVYGLETVASLLGKEGRDILRAGRALGPIGPRGVAVPQQTEMLLNSGLMVRPDILDSTGYAKDTMITGKRRMHPDWELLDPDEDAISPRDFLPMDTAAHLPTDELYWAGSVDELEDIGALYRPKFRKREGTAAQETAFNRLARALRGGKVDLTAKNVETIPNLNDENVRRRLVEDLESAAMRNQDITARIEAVRARKGIGSQRGYIKQARESATSRENIENQLKDVAKSFAKLADIPEKEALRRVSAAFSAVSPQTDIEGNWRRFNEALERVVPDDFGGLTAERFDEWLRTPAGRKLFESEGKSARNKAISALLGGRGTGASELLFGGRGDIRKTGLFADVLAGDVDSAIVDSGTIDRLLALLPDDVVDAVRRGVFNNSEIYALLVKAVNNAMEQGQLRRTAWAIRPRRTGRAGQQAALQLRKGSQTG